MFKRIFRKWNLEIIIKVFSGGVVLIFLWDIFLKLVQSSNYVFQQLLTHTVLQNGIFYSTEEKIKGCQTNNKLANTKGYSDIQGISGPVDLVLTWVNGSDQAFIDDMIRLDLRNKSFMPKRYRDWGTLRYALRSVEKHANWFRHVYIVTNGQTPHWLNLKCPRVTLVTHAQIFQNKSHLPSFNSLAIESHIHRIPGLSRHFIYMNDDFYFLNNVELKDFYTKETGIKIRVTHFKLGHCSKTCKMININNGICEPECNTSKCEWDGGDCWSSSPVTARNYDRLLSHTQPFRGAVLYTTFVYNKVFGSVDRQVPAHVPYVIDKCLMSELQDRIPEEWDKTSASRIRTRNNLLYGFAYYHYLLRPNGQNPEQKDFFPIATLITSSEDHVYSGTTNATALEKQLHNILNNKKKKFGCINDHTGLNEEGEIRTQRVIDSFFKKVFPKPSQFELR